MNFVKRSANKNCNKKLTDEQWAGKYYKHWKQGISALFPRKYSIHCETTADNVLQNSNDSWKYQRLRTILQRTVYSAFLFISEFITGPYPSVHIVRDATIICRIKCSNSCWPRKLLPKQRAHKRSPQILPNMRLSSCGTLVFFYGSYKGWRMDFTKRF